MSLLTSGDFVVLVVIINTNQHLSSRNNKLALKSITNILKEDRVYMKYFIAWYT